MQDYWTQKARGLGAAFSVAVLIQSFGVLLAHAQSSEGSSSTAPSLASGASVPASYSPAAASRTITDGALRRIVLPRLRPEAALFAGPTLISTGFSGNIYQRPILSAADRDAARDKPDYQFINLDGVVATLTNIDGYGFAPNGAEVTRPPLDRLYAREVGQVFGATTDDNDAPNLYVTATSAYGLQIVGPDRNSDYQPDRLLQGEPEARWMPGQWGFDPLAGPGSVWKVDGLTGKISLFATIGTGGLANSGPALGNIAYDAGHKQLFVSDLQSGLIHRLALDGSDLDQFDHGLVARGGAGLVPVAFDGASRVSITDFSFDPAVPDTWGFVDPRRRVWGLAVQDGRLFYAVASGKDPRPEVWSVGLDTAGAFTADARWELTLDPARPDYEISDMGFTADGALLLAQRGPREPKFDYTAFTGSGTAEVLRYSRETPDDPATPSVWNASTDRYAVGFADALTNTTGGLALGPVYDSEGNIDASDCRGTLWTSGENLRNSADLATALTAGGALGVDGAQAQPVTLLYDQNAPPWASYDTDFDATYPEEGKTGHIGDVAVIGCAEGAAKPATPPAKPKACAASTASLHCDSKTGSYVADIVVKPSGSLPISAVKLSDPSRQLTSLPQQLPFTKRFSVPLTGLVAGQHGQISICAFDASADPSKPYDCCNTSVTFTTPAQTCKKVSN